MNITKEQIFKIAVELLEEYNIPFTDTKDGLYLEESLNKVLKNNNIEYRKIVRWKCKLCGRDKFTRKSPHRCNTGFRKKRIIWEAIYECECNNLVYVESKNSHICLDCNKEYPESFFNAGEKKV